MNIYWKSFTSFVIFVVAYVAMAWYDYKFDCEYFLVGFFDYKNFLNILRNVKDDYYLKLLEINFYYELKPLLTFNIEKKYNEIHRFNIKYSSFCDDNFISSFNPSICTINKKLYVSIFYTICI